MFKKILIANRGEIACRVMRTARRMNLATVAVYSEADRNAPHVSLADEAVCIGPAPSSESYLRIDRIIEACRVTGAEAVHPGYGFLSENADFAEELQKAGIVFIGPNAVAIRSMGDKIASKKLAAAAGVNIIPGSSDAIPDASAAIKTARQIGYPVMLKASAGGGGKGMRIAHDDDQCREGFERATNEARASFGDGRIFLEKFIEQPRHIEIQILGDTHGNVIYLGERECSIQRRHQKVIEEAPSTFLGEPTRRAMGEQAVALARAVGYCSAGTVEFVVDAKKNFYFLEMNTRLQVEHPVTEYVTGLDLVELMIRVAMGEKLPFPQKQVRAQGWAIECRVCAEDPARDFLPSAGRLVKFLPPSPSDGIRVDSGAFEGGEVSIYYDSMIAKLIAYGDDRAQAIARIQYALDEFYIRGVSSNLNFLSALVTHPRFAAGDLNTNLIAEEFPSGFNPATRQSPPSEIVVVASVVIHRMYRDRASHISGQLPGYEPEIDGRWIVVIDQAEHDVMVNKTAPGFEVSYNGKAFAIESDWRFAEPIFKANINGEPVCLQVERRELAYQLTHGGIQHAVMVLSPKAAELLKRMPVKVATAASNQIVSPMPGLLSKLSVAVGQTIKAGQELAVIEAMKMENVIRSGRDGVIAKVLAAAGDTLAVNQPILEFEIRE